MIHFVMLTKHHLVILLAAHIIVYDNNVQTLEEKNFGTIINMQTGKQLTNALITALTDTSLEDCAEECMRRPRCLSINYLRRFLMCELNFGDTSLSEENLKVNPSAVYVEKSDIKKDLLSACAEKECDQHEKCSEDATGGAQCVISDCGFPPDVENAAYSIVNGIGVYSKVTYTCSDNTCLSSKPFIGCQANGNWSSVRFTCQDFCPSGWHQYKCSCYRVTKKGADWSTAQTKCKAENAYLAEVSSEAENEFLSNLLNGIQAWIGGTDKDHEGTWIWAETNRLIGKGYNGNPAYSNWLMGQLDNHRSWGDCLVMNIYGNWTNSYCYIKMSFVCEQDSALSNQ